MTRTSWGYIGLLALALASGLFGNGEQPHPNQNGIRKTFLVESNHPFVYLRFEELGEANPLFENESRKRVWLRLINNCRLPLNIRTFGLPASRYENEVGLMYFVAADNVRGEISLQPLPEPLSEGPERNAKRQKNEDEMPKGYWFDVGRMETIAPGSSVVFSIPVNHFGKRWHLEIPFQFDLPEGKGPRNPKTGGSPQMALWYSMSDMPENMQKQIEAK